MWGGFHPRLYHDRDHMKEMGWETSREMGVRAALTVWGRFLSALEWGFPPGSVWGIKSAWQTSDKLRLCGPSSVWFLSRGEDQRIAWHWLPVIIWTFTYYNSASQMESTEVCHHVGHWIWVRQEYTLIIYQPYTSYSINMTSCLNFYPVRKMSLVYWLYLSYFCF